MHRPHEILIRALPGLVGVLLLVWGFPQIFPLTSWDWKFSEAEARRFALEAFRELEEPARDAYIVVRVRGDVQLERRLLTSEIDPRTIVGSALAKTLLCWDVMVYPPGSQPGEWTHRAFVSPDGELLMLRLRGDGEADAPPDDDAARRLALEYLLRRGLAPDEIVGPGEVIRNPLSSRSLSARSDLRVQFHSTEQALGPEYGYGFEVYFSGPEASGFGPWYDDPTDDEIQRILRRQQIFDVASLILIFLILPIVAVAFLRRYHDGQLGVRRGLQFFALTLASAVVYSLLGQDASSEGSNIGFLTRWQMAWLSTGFMVIFFYLAASVLGLMSWSVGEFFCRQHQAQKLASLDALFRRRWSNATVAVSALQGVAGGVLMTGLLVALTVPARSYDIWAVASLVYRDGLGHTVGWLSILADGIATVVPLYLFGILLVSSWVRHLMGAKAGLLAAWLAITLFAPQMISLPLEGSWLLWAVVAVIPVLLFHFADLLSALLAGVVSQTLLFATPGFFASDPWIQLNAYGAVVLAAAPLILSARYLFSDEEFVYTYDDVPPHVRRIAERERQRVELETAAEIQGSILPDLPAQLHGVEIACSYLPASEVGGDFYDVLALEDGRLAVAVGDVAGHGVSSGLVMSMAKSALAVQVTFDPEVEAVFTTLNRMVYQNARRRLLATLCYALIDPVRRQLYYASAGHLYPYRVSLSGQVHGLETASYPLGVRGAIDVEVRAANLGPSDVIFMCSDGLVEACPEGSDDPFGFDRLEASLRRHVAKTPGQMRDAILDDVKAYCGSRPWDDDLTLLVLRLPAN